MLADDLFGFISFETPCSSVPAGHASLKVEHVDRVVGDALNKHLEAAGVSRDLIDGSLPGMKAPPPEGAEITQMGWEVYPAGFEGREGRRIAHETPYLIWNNKAPFAHAPQPTTSPNQFLPMLFLAVWGGLLADRVAKRRLLLVTQAAMAVPALAIWWRPTRRGRGRSISPRSSW